MVAFGSKAAQVGSFSCCNDLSKPKLGLYMCMLLVLAAASRTTLALDTRVSACGHKRSVKAAGMLDT